MCGHETHEVCSQYGHLVARREAGRSEALSIAFKVMFPMT